MKPAAQAAAAEPSRPLLLLAFELAPIWLLRLIAEACDARRRWPLLSFILFELAAILTGTMFALVLLVFA